MTVAEEDTATAQNTGDVPVLSTSRLLELMQNATMDALAGNLPEGMMTAGLRINLDHLQASGVGTVVESSSVLTRMEGRRLIFEADAHANGQLVCTGRIIRVQIDRDKFLSSL